MKSDDKRPPPRPPEPRDPREQARWLRLQPPSQIYRAGRPQPPGLLALQILGAKIHKVD